MEPRASHIVGKHSDNITPVTLVYRNRLFIARHSFLSPAQRSVQPDFSDFSTFLCTEPPAVRECTAYFPPLHCPHASPGDSSTPHLPVSCRLNSGINDLLGGAFLASLPKVCQLLLLSCLETLTFSSCLLVCVPFARHTGPLGLEIKGTYPSLSNT